MTSVPSVGLEAAMASRDDDVTRDLFHCCALIAFVEQAAAEGGPPDPEATRLLACRLYEQELKKINAAKP